MVEGWVGWRCECMNPLRLATLAASPFCCAKRGGSASSSLRSPRPPFAAQKGEGSRPPRCAKRNGLRASRPFWVPAFAGMTG